MTRARTIIAAAAVALTLAACAADEPETQSIELAPAQEQEQTEPAADDEQSQGEEGGPGDGTDGGEPAGSSEYLDELRADALHDGVDPAAPGTAYIEYVSGRLEFSKVTCSLSEDAGKEHLYIVASEDTEGVGHMMYMNRSIGEEIGWDWEDELVQLALLGERNGEPRMSNALAQHDRPKDGDPEWLKGEGASPLVRIVGDAATSTGSFDEVPSAAEPVGGSFVAAATCP